MATSVVTPYEAVPANVDLNARNTAATNSAKRSALLDFADVDRIDDNLFNEILWKGIRDEDAVVPAPRRGALVRVVARDDD